MLNATIAVAPAGQALFFFKVSSRRGFWVDRKENDPKALLMYQSC